MSGGHGDEYYESTGTEEECDANIVKYFAYLRAPCCGAASSRSLDTQIGEHHYLEAPVGARAARGPDLEASYPNVEMRDGKRRSVPIS